MEVLNILMNVAMYSEFGRDVNDGLWTDVVPPGAR